MIVKLDRIHPEDRYKFSNIDFGNFFMRRLELLEQTMKLEMFCLEQTP